MTPSRIRAVLRVWSLALALSAMLAAAGERWPDPLPIQPALVWALVLLPPLGMTLVLAAGWALPGQEGESSGMDRETSR
ncbi:MAG: hypothetical protein WCF98_06120 [Synechococcus sp. ELA057]|jgi:hypothetical protein